MEKMIDENGEEWIVGYDDEPDYIPGYDDGEWPDDMCGEEEFAWKEMKMTISNNLDSIFSAMRTGKYGCVIDTKGNAHVGIINCVMREDGSGKNWIVTITNKTVGHENVFFHAK